MKRLFFALILVLFVLGNAFGSVIFYEPLNGTSTPTGWQIKGSDSGGSKDELGHYL